MGISANLGLDTAITINTSLMLISGERFVVKMFVESLIALHMSQYVLKYCVLEWFFINIDDHYHVCFIVVFTQCFNLQINCRNEILFDQIWSVWSGFIDCLLCVSSTAPSTNPGVWYLLFHEKSCKTKRNVREW